MKNLKLLISMAIALFSNTTLFAQKHEKDVSSHFLFSFKEIVVDGVSMAYYEQGEGTPTLFLHGLPTSSYIWRNILPAAATQGRAIAVDLAGYGKSGLPLNEDYSIQSQYTYLKGFIDSLQLKDITLVVNDLGSLLGLKYAVENPENIRGIVFIEAAFMPTEQWFRQLTFLQKMMFKMMNNPKRACKLIVEKNKIPKMMMKMAVVRKLSKFEMNWYLEPFEVDIERRKVMLYGPGPATFPANGISKSEGDFADEINKVAVGLIKMNESVPFLLFYASPGIITRKPAIQYAKKNFINITFIDLGKGKHFLQEDHPEAISNGLKKWLNETK